VILVDTSAWVEYDRATGSTVDQRLTALIAGGGPLCVTEPVVTEVVAGARDDTREGQLRRLLRSVDLLPLDAAVDFDAAATIYRRCRQSEITPRGMVDCLVAAVAWRHQAALLAYDADLARISIVMGIEMDAGSLLA